MEDLARQPVRRVGLAAGPPRWALMADASPWGAGAVLFALPSGVALEYWAMSWTAADTQKASIRIGDSVSQASVELLAILLAVHVWGRKFAEAGCGMGVRSDFVAALRATEKLARSTPQMNSFSAEVALKLEDSARTRCRWCTYRAP